MPSKQTKKPENECPVTFCWATFCKNVLQEHDSSERSLIGLLPGLRGGVSLPSSEVDEKVALALGTMYVHAVFKRKEAFSGPLNVNFTVDIRFENQESAANVSLNFSENNDYGQLSLKLANPSIEIPRNIGQYKLRAEVQFNVDSQPIGKVEMPITIDVGGS